MSGQEIRLGDKVELGDGAVGEVVGSIDTGEFLPQYPQNQWHYLKHGVLVNFPKYGLIHYQSLEPDLRLVARAPAAA